MKKVFMILATLTLLCGSALAQKEVLKSTIDTSRHRGEHGVGWIRSHIADNWTLSIQGGSNIYMGYEDYKGPLLDRPGLNFSFNAGRWIFPVVGIRFGAGFAKSHGFISADSYLAHRSDCIRDYGNCEGSGGVITNVGGTPITGALGGYFWTVDGGDELLSQNWRYAHAGADFMVNISYLRPYDKVVIDNKWSHIVYLGYNIRVGLSEDNPEKYSNFIGHSTSGNFKGFKNTNFANEGHIGYICKYAISKHLNLHADIRLSIIEGDFDRERIPNVEKIGPDMELGVFGGITYDFNLRSDEARLTYYIKKGILTPNATEAPKFNAYVQVEDVDIIQRIDTLLIVLTDTIDDIRHIEYKRTIEKEVEEMKRRFEELPTSTPLDVILSRRLLPYEMVFFELDKWNIQPTEEMKIAKMARIMKAFPDYKFTLYGSADSKTGTVSRNDFLSHNRADVVYRKLVQQYGIPEEQLQRVYMGGILDYDPFELNRATVIIMEHPAVRAEFEKMRSQRKAGGGVTEY